MKNTNTIYQNQEETLIDKSDSYRIGDEQKIKLIANHFKEIMNIIGLDLNDDSLNDTPHRVAKMYVKEIFSGLNPDNKPEITVTIQFQK